MKKFYYMLIVVAAIMWGSTGIFTTVLANAEINTTELSLIKSGLATIITGIIFLITDRSVFKLEKITDIKYFIGMGIISYSFFNWSYIMAIKETSMGVAAILLYTAPSIIMVLSVILFKEKLTMKKIIIVAITFVGCILVTGLDSGMGAISAKGLIFGICSGVGYAMYSIFGKFALRKYSSKTAVFYMLLCSTIPFLLANNPASVVMKFTETNMWGVGIGFAFVAAVIPYLTYTKALEHVEASKASLIATLEPVVAAVFGIVLFSESASVSKVIGIILVLGSVAVMSMEKPE